MTQPKTNTVLDAPTSVGSNQSVPYKYKRRAAIDYETEGMPKLFKQTWDVVNDKGLPFPLIMLTHHACFPDRIEDAIAIQGSVTSQELAADRHKQLYPRVKLRCWTRRETDELNDGEWQAHGWRIDKQSVQKVLLGTLIEEITPETSKSEHERLQIELTERQTQVLIMIANGKTSKEIATTLEISVRTAEFHRAALMQRLGLKSTAELTQYALRRNLL